MKKIFIILSFFLLFFSHSYSEINDPFEIKLTCKDDKVGIPISITINPIKEEVSYQGSDPDSYFLKNDVFVFSMLAGEHTYSYHLNRNTGLLRIKAYLFSKEQERNNYKEAVDIMIANKLINTENGDYNKSDLVRVIHEIYEKKNPKEVFFMNCEKSKSKF